MDFGGNQYIVARCIGCVALLPLGGTRFSIGKRLGLALLLSASCLALPVPRASAYSLAQFGLEFLIGLSLSAPLVIVLTCIDAFGEFIDVGRGQSIGSFYDPLLRTNSSQTGALLRAYFLAYISLTGFLELLVKPLVSSLYTLPVAQMSLESISHSAVSCALWISSALVYFFSGLCPFFLVYLCVDAGIGMATRGSTQNMLYAESFVIKTALALLMLALTLWQFELTESWLAFLAQPAASYFVRGG